MIRFQTVYGLCNRMRGIVGAIELGRQLNRKVEVFWIPDTDLPAKFTDLFEPLDSPWVKKVQHKKSFMLYLVTIRKRYITKIIRMLTGQKLFLAYEIHDYLEKENDLSEMASRYRTFNYKSEKNVCHHTARCFDIFVPIDPLRKRIEAIEHQFNEFTYGVHIRRTDHVQSILKSPNDIFILEIAEKLKLNPQAKFYIASDDLAIKEQLLKQFPNHVITDTDVVHRKSLGDLERAVVELFALSKTKKVYGSFASSFSQTAAEIGNIDFEILKKN